MKSNPDSQSYNSTMDRDRISESLHRSLGPKKITVNVLLGKWFGWSALAFLSILGAVLLGIYSINDWQKRQNTLHLTYQLKAEVEEIARRALWVAEGGRQDPAAINELWTSINGDLVILRNGGVARNGELPIFNVEEHWGISTANLQDGLKDLEASLAPIRERSSVIASGQKAQQDFPKSIEAAQQIADELAVQAEIAQNKAWIDAMARVRAQLRRPEIATLSVVFAPTPGTDALKQQWIKVFQDEKSRVDQLLEQPGASSGEGDFRRISSALGNMLQQMMSMASAQPVLIEAGEQKGNIIAAAEKATSSMDILSDAVEKNASGLGFLFLGLIVLAVLVVVGVLGLSWVAMTLKQDSWQATEDNRLGGEQQYSLERLNRHIKKLLDPTSGGFSKGARLDETEKSGYYYIALLLNKALEANERRIEENERAAKALSETLQEGHRGVASVTAVNNQQIQDLKQGVDGIWRSAEALAVWSKNQEAWRDENQTVISMGRGQSAITQESLIRSEGLREHIQETAKRLKRLGESLQGLSEVTDAFEELTQQIQVISMNLGIEASAVPVDVGRPLMVLAQDLQRVSIQANKVVVRVDDSIGSIHSEAQMTLSTMESATGEVVGLEALIRRFSGLLRDWDKKMQEQTSSSMKLQKDGEQNTIQVSEGVFKIKTLLDSMEILQQELLGVQASLDKGREVGRHLRRQSNN